MRTATFDVSCAACGTVHDYPLDPAGRYEGPSRCPKDPPDCVVRLRVDPRAWRAIVERASQTEVH